MIAIDTNVLIYACDRSDERRQQAAIELISRQTDGILLWQVACEFIAASRRLTKNGFTPSQAWERLSEFLGVLRLAVPEQSVLSAAKSLHLQSNVGFWDAMIIAACMQAGADVLYSEDIPSAANLGGLRIINPFT